MTATLAALSDRIDAIVIGASAGGIDALMWLLPAFSARASVAVFVVLHLPRQHESLLVNIFEPRCAISVVEAADKQRVEAGTVYFAPPDYHLLIDAGPALSLSVDDLVNYSRPSIDVLFESAADVFGERLLGVVLTGGNQDGASGLAAIARAGGITVVQDPGSAQVDVMPLAALTLVPSASVLPLARIAELFAAVEGALP